MVVLSYTITTIPPYLAKIIKQLGLDQYRCDLIVRDHVNTYWFLTVLCYGIRYHSIHLFEFLIPHDKINPVKTGSKFSSMWLVTYSFLYPASQFFKIMFGSVGQLVAIDIGSPKRNYNFNSIFHHLFSNNFTLAFIVWYQSEKIITSYRQLWGSASIA